MKKNIVKSTLLLTGFALLLLNGSAYAASKKCYTRLVTSEGKKQVIVLPEKNHGKMGNWSCRTESWFRFSVEMKDQRTWGNVTNLLWGICGRTQKAELQLWPKYDRSRNSKRRWKNAIKDKSIAYACP